MYQITRKKRTIENKEMTVYGVYYNDECNVSDVSADRLLIEGLVKKCNKNQLAPIHLNYIIEDFLSA